MRLAPFTAVLSDSQIQRALPVRQQYSSHLPELCRGQFGCRLSAVADGLGYHTAHLFARTQRNAQLALRYRLKNKFYVTALGEYGKQSHRTSRILCGDDLWGCNLRASFDFVFGPISIQTNYSNLSKNVGLYINAGVLF